MDQISEEHAIKEIVRDAKSHHCVTTYFLISKVTGIHSLRVGSILRSTKDPELMELAPFVVGSLEDHYYIKTQNETYSYQLETLEDHGIPIFDFSAIPDPNKANRILREIGDNTNFDERRLIPETKIWFPVNKAA